MALKYHPDRHPNSPFHSEKFLQIKKASEILLSDEKRGLYDRYLSKLEKQKKHLEKQSEAR